MTIFVTGGHRGSGCTDTKYAQTRYGADPNAPAENTVASVLKAFNAGAFFVEIDAIPTLDDQIAVTHTNDLKQHVFHRLDHAYVGDMDSGDIVLLNCGYRQDGKIPFLPDILRITKTLPAYKSSDYVINIELKDVKRTDQLKYRRGAGNFFDLVLRDIQLSDFDISKVVFSSFALHDLIEMRKRFEKVRLGMLFIPDHEEEAELYSGQGVPNSRTMQFTTANIERAYKAAGIEFVHPEIHSFSKETIAGARELHLSFNTWALNEEHPNKDKDSILLAVDLMNHPDIKAAGLITDFVQPMQKLLHENRPELFS